MQQYKNQELIYPGKHFSVYRAISIADDKKVILKTCRSDQPTLNDLTALNHEYQILQQLTNVPHVTKAYDLIRDKQNLILVLEDLEGISLAKYLNHKPLPIDTFFNIAIQIVDALIDIHDQHIIHKDINPNNIIINPTTLLIKIIDFNIASQLDQENYESILLSNLEGTLTYISPEQTGRMNKPIDYRSDFYSLGVSFYEMLTGQPPFTSNDVLDMIHSHLAKVPTAIQQFNPHVPQAISELINKLLAKVPDQRYASARGIKADLIKCQLQWEKKQDITPFTLASQDIHDHLTLSSKLYGREQQLKELLSCFDEVAKGATKIMMIAGYSGIGKTSLVKEIYKPITKEHGYFISGKFDQLQRATPYSAFIDALQELIRRLLTEPEETLQKLKEKLQHALGNNAQIIVDVIPNLGLIIGAQPAVTQLPPTEAQNRFLATFQKFIEALASKEHPLVFFVDDLQWADMASLEVIKSMAANNDLHHFFFIGAYRDNEVSIEHPLMLALDMMNKNMVIQSITLEPLNKLDIQSLLADSFNCSLHRVAPLSDLLIAKAGGNPFFSSEFIKLIYQKKLLKYSHNDREWQWQIDEIEQLAVTANVVELLMQRLRQLPFATQELLQLGACIGHNFDLQTLIIISEKNFSDVITGLWEAIKANLIRPAVGGYKLNALTEEFLLNSHFKTNEVKFYFVHDRIQQAAYELIPEQLKQQVHLRICYLLLQGEILTEQDERLAIVVNHYQQSLDLIATANEKQQIAIYFYWAAKKAKAASAFSAAKNYLMSAIKLLSPVNWQASDILLPYETYKELAICEYLTGNFNEAESGFKQLLVYARTTLEKLEIYKLSCEMLATLNKHSEAINLAVHALQLVNIRLAVNPNMLHLLKAILTVKLQVMNKDIPNIKLAPVSNPEYGAAMELLSGIYGSSFMTNQTFFILLTTTCLSVSLKYGYTVNTVASCLVYAFTNMHAFNWYKQGLLFTELAENISKLQVNSSYRGKNNFILGCFINPWRMELSKSIETLNEAYENSYQIGDLIFCNYSNFLRLITVFMSGDYISVIKKHIDITQQFAKKAQTSDFHAGVLTLKMSVDALTKSENEINNINTLEEMVISEKNNTSIAFFYGFCARLYFIFNEFKEAKMMGEKHLQYSAYDLATVSHPEGLFYYAISILVQVKNYKQLSEKKAKLVKQILNKFRRWNNWQSQNYGSYLNILEAKIAHLKNNTDLAIKNYQKALNIAKSQNILHLVAIIYELLSQFYQSLEIEEAAKYYYLKSYQAYKNWGASTKCELMKKANPEWIYINDNSATLSIPTTNTAKTENLPIDLLAVLKSAQIINSEIRFDILLEKLLLVSMQDAGAERGILITEEKNAWYVAAENMTNSHKVTLLRVKPLKERNDIPLVLLNYTMRSQEPILINKSEDLAPYLEKDNYLKTTKPQSILILPIKHKNKLCGMLYLENRNVSYAFTPNTIKILELLMSQAAISLENAKLYHQATHDPLTGLANRNFLYQYFDYLRHDSDKNDKSLAVLYLDLDGFKKINDTLGHDVGDELLIYFSKKLSGCVKESDLVVRLGGDEFVILLVNYTNQHAIVSVAENILNNFTIPAKILTHIIPIGTSIGISIAHNKTTSIQQMLKEADIALYKVKSKGKGYYQIYSAELPEQMNKE